jgi:hypothetical protein
MAADYFQTGAVDQAALPQTAREGAVERAHQPGRAVADPQQRRAQPAGDQAGEEVVPRVGGLRAGWAEPDEDRLAVGIDSPGGQDRLGRRAGVHLEVAGVQEQVVQADARQVAGLPGSELVADALADPADGRLGQGGFGAEHLGQGSLDVAVGQPADPPGDHQGFQRVGAGHAGTEQPGAERLIGVAQLGALQVHLAHRGVHRGRRLPAVAAAGRPVGLTTLIAGTAEERLDLGL